MKSRERLIIKNFGPIEYLNIDIRQVNIFIGPTSTGKSIVAKLLSIFREPRWLQVSTVKSFSELLNHYNIQFGFESETEIRYENYGHSWTVKAKECITDFPFAGNLFETFFKDSLSPEDDIELSIKKFIGLLINHQDLDKASKLLKAARPKSKITKVIGELLKIQPNFILPNVSSSFNPMIQFGEKIEELSELLAKEYSFSHPLYIPAERILYSMVSETIYGLFNEKINLAKCFTDFSQRFLDARNEVKTLDIPELNASYSFKGKNNIVTLKDGKSIKLDMASSGFQSLVPLKVVLSSYGLHKNKQRFIVIEEPEINLYPTAQKELVEQIIGNSNKRSDQICITTHSPYVITTIDNLMKAGQTAINKPNKQKQIDNVVSSSQWLNFQNVACYYFEGGKAKSILNKKLKTIDGNKMDDVSEELAADHEKLLNLQYA